MDINDSAEWLLNSKHLNEQISQKYERLKQRIEGQFSSNGDLPQLEVSAINLSPGKT